ncbi:MAG: arginine--tRNA ligase, partial [Ruthenibacterium sp.]
KKVNVEFVSANPTGPMHLGNARGGALGDGLAAALDWAGYDVTREFLINDAGNQIVKFGKSLATRYLQIYKGEDAVPFPEDGYQGED